nr:hypothetical protein Itr_chr14CG12980 [Ipomoea trifida]
MRRSPAFANHHATPFFSTSDTADARHSEPLTSDTVDVATVDTRCCRRQQREGRQPPAILASRLQPRYITAAIHHCRRLQKTMTTAVSRHGDRDRQRPSPALIMGMLAVAAALLAAPLSKCLMTIISE